MQEAMFDGMDGASVKSTVASESEAWPEAAPRLQQADRSQMFLDSVCLDERVPANHQVRLIWAAVSRLDLGRYYDAIEARGSGPGRAAIDPKILVALWLYAATDGVGSGRRVAALCERDDMYRWICGGVRVNYHTLNDFRVQHEQALDDLFTQVLSILVHQGLVKVTRLSQDGVRVRASAGKGSFRRRGTLEEKRALMREHVKALKQQNEGESVSRAEAAQRRAVQEQMDRLEAAMQELERVEQAKARQKSKPSKHRDARASTTDPEARVMRMADGGSRPAYNVQWGADVESRAIVGVIVTNAGNDVDQSQPMRELVQSQTGRRVQEHLMDGGYVGLASVEKAESEGVAVYAPVPEPKSSRDPASPLAGDGPGVKQWRARMAEPSAKKIYQQRAAVSETINADITTHRSLDRFRVRGLGKARCVALWTALAYNLLHFAAVMISS
jgi:transposase